MLSQCTVPQANDSRSSKVVTLNVRVSDQDLEAGRFRAEASTTNPFPPPRRRRRGRPRKASLLAAAIAAQSSRSEHGHQQRLSPSLSDFRAVSAYSFPMLLTPAKSVQGLNQHASTPLASAPIVPNHPCKSSDVQPVNHPTPNTDTEEKVTTPRLSKGPNTMAFWWDRAIAEQAMNSSNVDFKMICLNLMRCKNRNTVPHQRTVRGISWEVMLSDAVARGKAWRRARRQRQGQSKKAADWAVWETRKRSESRGRFVKDGPRGAWRLHPRGFEGKVRRLLRLGYKRQGRPRQAGAFDKDIADHWIDIEKFRDSFGCADVSELDTSG